MSACKVLCCHFFLILMGVFCLLPSIGLAVELNSRSCLRQKVCKTRASLFFGGDESVLDRQVSSSLLSQLQTALEYAQDLKKAADQASSIGDYDLATAYLARYLMVARVWLGPNLKMVPKSLSSQVRDAYLQLAERQLEAGEGADAKSLYALAEHLFPNDSEVHSLKQKLSELSQAAYLRGYGLYRDGGSGASARARRLWQFAIEASPESNSMTFKAEQLLKETAP